ncbi:MAG: VTT domain-containing protein [Candidatus Paceibacterota bacterium]|jgi:membrane protein DedA with SNARE-associated domain
MIPFLSYFITDAIGSALLLSLAIVIGTFFLEDATTLIVGLLAADGVIPIPIALLSLYAGVLCGDLGFYSLGRLARTHRRLARYVDHDLAAPLRVWLETRFILTVFSARFIPGSRFTTYAASGFFRSPFSTFIGTTIAATLIWITFLFCVSYWFGSTTSRWLGPLRWSIAITFLLTLFFVGRHNLLAYRAKRCELTV